MTIQIPNVGISIPNFGIEIPTGGISIPAGWISIPTVGISTHRLCASRPPEGNLESRNVPRQLLGMRTRHVLELAGQNLIDGRLVPPRQVVQHLLLIPRHPRPQLDEPDRLRQDGGGIIAERLLDDGLLPD